MDTKTIIFLIGVPFATVFISQTIKFIIKSFQKPSDEPNWRYIEDYGGMPSSHTAFLISLDTAVYLMEGIYSAAFAIAIIFTIIIVRDALGLRTLIGEHAKALNGLIRELPEEKKKNFPKHLEETIGHTSWEVLVGGLLGFALTYLAYLIIF